MQREAPPAKFVCKVQLWHKGSSMMKGVGVDTKYSAADWASSVSIGVSMHASTPTFTCTCVYAEHFIHCGLEI